MDLVLLKMFNWRCRCCCRRHCCCRFCSAYSSKTHSITKVNLPLCLALNLERCPNVSKTLIVLSLALCLFVCIFLLRRSIIISSLTTVKSVTCSFSFTHLLDTPNSFTTTVYRFCSYCLSAAAAVSVCEWVFDFLFWLCLPLSLSRVHLNMRNVKITAKWLFHSIEILTTASMEPEKRKRYLFSSTHLYVVSFFTSEFERSNTITFTSVRLRSRWMYWRKINSKLWLSHL